MTPEEKWKQFVEEYDVSPSETEVENEMRLIRLNMRHSMQYDALTGSKIHLFPEKELEEQHEMIREMAFFEVKSELVMKKILEQQKFTVTQEELEAEAAAMAQRQNMPLDMVKDFLGEDLSMLERDVQERKALEWVCTQIE